MREAPAFKRMVLTLLPRQIAAWRTGSKKFFTNSKNQESF
jgi:hypothetical protein